MANHHEKGRCTSATHGRIVSTCIVFHNIFIGKDGFDRGWMKKFEKELQRWVDEETLRGRHELKGERLAIVEVKVKIHHEKNVTQGEEFDRDIETLFIKENEKDENLLHEATMMHEVIGKSLWHYKIKNSPKYNL